MCCKVIELLEKHARYEKEKPCKEPEESNTENLELQNRKISCNLLHAFNSKLEKNVEFQWHNFNGYMT